MKGLNAAFVALAAFVAPSFAAVKLSREPTGAPRFVENKLIIELENPNVLGKRDDSYIDVHARFFEELDRRLPANSLKVHEKFTSELFTGAEIEVTSIEDVKKIAAQLKGVKAVRPVPIYPRPELKLSDPPAFKEAPQQYPPIIMTGADRIHAAGNTGKGIKIGIIDTGIDYTHPALGGGFGAGFKVAGGYDFVGDDFQSGLIPVPDDDPLDQCAGHGTHVAGIVAANPNNEYNVTGVASDATLSAYRIFGCTGSTEDGMTVKALLRAYDEGNDIITLSLGHVDSWTTGTSSVVASRIAASGRVVTASAGNDGDYGLWYTGAPSNGQDVISVASIDNINSVVPFKILTSLPGLGPFNYIGDGTFGPLGPADIALPLYATSTDPLIADDGCNPLPANTPDLSKYVTLVRRGTCNFTVKIANVVAKGGKYIIIRNNGGTFGTIGTGGYRQLGMVQDADGIALLNAFIAGTNFTISFSQAGAGLYQPNTATGGIASDFSSYGPTYDMFFKPSIAAPGGIILSTWPVPLGAWRVTGGTSMSCPHTAGLAALVLKAKGKAYAKNVRTLLQTTSTAVKETTEETSRKNTLAQVGAGQANIFNALTYETTLTPAELLLNDTANWQGLHTIWIKNTGKKTKTYTITHVPAGTAYTFPAGSIVNEEGRLPLDDTALTVKLSLTKAVILPGISLPIIVSIEAPKNAAKARIPIYSGHIEVATAGEILKASYIGAGTDLKTAPVVDNTGEFLGVPMPVILDAVGDIQTEPTSYTFVGDDYPVFIWRQVLGSARLTVDLVTATSTVKPNIKRGVVGDWIGNLIGGWFPGSKAGTYGKVPILGNVFEYTYLSRNDLVEYVTWSEAIPAAVFSNGTAIAPGSYKFLARFLKIGGNPANQDHYETWLSPVINVVTA